ncbi:ABC transporter substrate-binding protein [Bartonella sp. HY038]|uniref:ABC transporter substrate-binding protein n=1 Tax=Bartonella sp. HY038 TaxID=2759660 RepID=UPI0015FA9812|nr:ABC transporter substrate-binding protein [Bartonella sp. HY038]
MNKNIKLLAKSLLFILIIAFSLTKAQAEVNEVRVSRGYGILYLPLIVMQDQKIFEKKAKEEGLGDLNVKWVILDGGNVINDAMMAGSIDIAGTGAPGFITLWSKARGIPNVEVIGLTALSATSLWLNTNRDHIKTLSDFKSGDKIAIPGIKTSLAAVVLQMIAAKEFGHDNYAKLDPLTVALPHPEAVAALIAGKTEIVAHFTSPPFQQIEIKSDHIHRVVNSVDYVGNLTLDVTYAPKRFVDANPQTTKAFIDALDETNKFIAENKELAAEIFVNSSKVKIDKDEILAIINDPDTKFSTTPVNVMNFAEFLGLSGTIKTKPNDWKDLFVPYLHERDGS